MRRALPPALAAVGALALWQALASLGSVDELTLASPVEVAEALGRDHRLLAANAAVTLVEVASGLLAAIALGAAGAVAMHLVRPLRAAAYPMLVASQAIPVVVLAPLLVLALDYGVGPKIAIVALVSFFPVTVGLLDGLRSVDPELLKLMRGLGASRSDTLRKVELPAALPRFFSGLRVATTVSVVGAVFGEWAGADAGLGRLVLLGSAQLEAPRVYAAVAILALMAIGLFALVSVVERAVAPWARDPVP